MRSLSEDTYLPWDKGSPGIWHSTCKGPAAVTSWEAKAEGEKSEGVREGGCGASISWLRSGLHLECSESHGRVVCRGCWSDTDVPRMP